MARTIVIVDDHHGFRAEARELLEDEGFRVAGEAADGLSAIELVRQRRPDVVLLDVQLPDINGFDVASRLAEEVPESRVVMISSREASDYRGHLRSNRHLVFISKAELSGAAMTEALEERE